MNPIKISIVLPAYNEGKNIAKNVQTVYQCFQEKLDNFEIVVVDDGSKDDTLKNAKLAAADNSKVVVVAAPINKGKGNALKLGVEAAKGEYIAFLDADLDISPEHILNGLEMVEKSGADIIIASKWHKDSHLDYPFTRKIISYGYYTFIRILFNLKVKDTQTGAKIFKSKYIKKIMKQVQTDRYAFDIEILAIANKWKLTIQEMPVEIIFQRGGIGRIGIKDIWVMIIDTLGIFYRVRLRKNKVGK